MFASGAFADTTGATVEESLTGGSPATGPSAAARPCCGFSSPACPSCAASTCPWPAGACPVASCPCTALVVPCGVSVAGAATGAIGAGGANMFWPGGGSSAMPSPRPSGVRSCCGAGGCCTSFRMLIPNASASAAGSFWNWFSASSCCCSAAVRCGFASRLVRNRSTAAAKSPRVTPPFSRSSTGLRAPALAPACAPAPCACALGSGGGGAPGARPPFSASIARSTPTMPPPIMPPTTAAAPAASGTPSHSDWFGSTCDWMP